MTRRPRRTSDVLRHRHRFVCWWPRWDTSGLWAQRTWLWWSWDFMPPRIGMRVVAMVNDMRAGK